MADEGASPPDGLPSGLEELGPFYNQVVLHSHGSLADRPEGFLQWQRALRNGWLPDPGAVRWPDSRYSQALRAGLEGLDIARYLPAHHDLLEPMMRSLLEAVAAGEDGRFAAADRGSGEEGSWNAGTEAARASIVARWAPLMRAWKALEQVFGDGTGPTILASLGEGAAAWVRALIDGSGEEPPGTARSWGLEQGVDHRVDLRVILDLARRLQGYPKLVELAAALGRERPDEKREAGLEAAVEALASTRRSVERIRDPRLPGPPNGLDRSDDVSRMVASEAALLTNPTLRLVWHAKRADAGLLSYRREGEVRKEVVETRIESREVEKPRQELTRGPILVCLDTSGSMGGGPEALAKAVLLEVLKIALKEKRACVVYGFSGPGQVHETVLEGDGAGLPRMLEMLSHSFGSGTDVAEPLRRATEQLEESGWQKADLLVLSDGGFGVGDDVLQRLAAAKATHGLRSFGVHIGAYGRSTMQQICDRLEEASPWVR